MKYKTRLEARVAAQNKANAEAIQLHQEFSRFFEPLVGKKILSVSDNSFLKKFKEGIDAGFARSKERSGCHAYFSGYRDYSLSIDVRASETYQGEGDWTERDGNMNAQAIVNVAMMENGGVLVARSGKIEKLCELHPLRVDYTAEEVLANRADHKAKKEIADAAQSKLSPFGEYDS